MGCAAVTAFSAAALYRRLTAARLSQQLSVLPPAERDAALQPFSGTDQKVLDILAAHTAIALKNADLYEKATVDVLTRVSVRRLFFQKLEAQL